ncbi:MAG: DUF1232 domain-containing protein [Halanaerobiales bacterium]|nr:DUF1232 domain-containing protein [Halanaerobiales bacterium]
MGKLRNISLLFRYLNDQKISVWSKLLFSLPLLYFISPIDLFPDIFFPFGYLEDIGVLIFGWQMIKKELEKYRMGSAPKKDNVVNLNRDDYKVE